MQGLFGVGVTITALPDVVGLQFDVCPDGGDWLVTGLQVDAGEQSQTAGAGLIFNPFIKAWEEARRDNEWKKVRSQCRAVNINFSVYHT